MLGSRPRHDKSRITAAGAMLFALVVCGFCYDVAGPAAAQNWPTRPLTTVVPFAPGGGTDVLGRIVGRRLFLAAIFLTVAIIVLGPACARADDRDDFERAVRKGGRCGRCHLRSQRVAPVSPAAPQTALGSDICRPTGRV